MTTLRQLIRQVLTSDPVRRDQREMLIELIRYRNGGDYFDACHYLYICGQLDAASNLEK